MAGIERDGTPHGRADDPGDNASSSLGEMASSHDRCLAWSARGVLAQHNAVRTLDAADVHVAATLARVTDEQDETVMLAAALATRAVRQGSVAIDLRDVFPYIDPAPAQDADAWTDRVRASRLAEHRALIVEHDLVYLQRYHQQEVAVVLDLRERAAQPAPVVDEEVLAAGLPRVFPGPNYAEARTAAQIALRSWTSALTGGPGTGKTTTVAGVLALLAEQAAARGERLLRVGLAAPTGKAAARMKEAVTAALGQILQRTSDPAARAVIEPLAGVPTLTLHRMLGRSNDSSTRFRYDRTHRLPHDVVVVDESSMVSLTHMARLLEALRPTTRLILVGDPDQLVSVDAGAVLADIVAGIGTGTGAVAGRNQATPHPLEGGRTNAPVALARLRTAHRYGRTIGELAEHLRAGDAGAVMGQLTSTASNPESGDGAVSWQSEPDDHTPLRALLVRHALSIRSAALAGDIPTALGLLDEHRLLCAHREGPRGVRTWNARIEGWLTQETGDPLYDPMYVGRPLLITRNDYATGVFNGDTGVVVADHVAGVACPVAVIRGSAGGGRCDDDHAHGDQRFGPSRLGDVETMHAMTIHKAQGSQARKVTVLLPDRDSPLLTRELLYTAVTRAQERVHIVGSEAAIRAAVGRRVVRATGLRQRLRSLG